MTETDEEPESQQKRLTDLDHENELVAMVNRLYALRTVIHEAFDDDTIRAASAFRLLEDVYDRMEGCTLAFADERKLREAERAEMAAKMAEARGR
jgi:hypothetical protein